MGGRTALHAAGTGRSARRSEKLGKLIASFIWGKIIFLSSFVRFGSMRSIKLRAGLDVGGFGLWQHVFFFYIFALVVFL